MLIPQRYDLFVIPMEVKHMNTRKIAISLPTDLVSMIDELRTKKKVSRSGYISRVLLEKIEEERRKKVREAFDEVFSDEEICKEQLETAKWLEGADLDEGQEW
jgi:hypothetical protein